MSTATKSKPPKKKPAPGYRSIKSGPALKVWRREQGISRPIFAQIANCSERTLATREGQQTLPENFVRPVTEAVRLVQALKELAGDDGALKDWLSRPNRAFDSRSPLDLIRNGEADLLWEMVYQLRQGAFA